MDSPHRSDTLEDALRTELQSGPSPVAITAIDRRVSAALAARSFGSTSTRQWLRQITVAPIMAIVGALVLGTVIVAAALVLTPEDQRVHDLTACMRDRGWDIADPNVDNGTGQIVPGFSTIVDGAQQPAFNADLEDCAANAGIPLER